MLGIPILATNIQIAPANSNINNPPHFFNFHECMTLQVDNVEIKLTEIQSVTSATKQKSHSQQNGICVFPIEIAK